MQAVTPRSPPDGRREESREIAFTKHKSITFRFRGLDPFTSCCHPLQQHRDK
ncbi:hypothetical protein E2C01_050965 [Portunus trituberculatus]|uniref:Uncharacterized protein n=1 Tax=Portunus trituberculatus TaxID=210409 RepID=A0A5B7GIB0_PORTR|nr:hypothetical protein [Portunus trituberculatus]